MLPPPWSDPLKFRTLFEADAMFFRSAQSALIFARDAREGASTAEDELRRQVERLHDLCREFTNAGADDESAHGGRDIGAYQPVRYAEFTAQATALESFEYEVAEAYGPLLQGLSHVLIFSALALEAHINIRAEALLPAPQWKKFKRLGDDAKWLWLPKMVGLDGFDENAEPFRSFRGVIRARHALVHYKAVTHITEGQTADPSGFADQLGLTFTDAERAIQTVRSMISALSAQLNERRPPWWLDSEGSHFFRLQLEK
jgi:hypothetical protein